MTAMSEVLLDGIEQLRRNGAVNVIRDLLPNVFAL
jgi:hypothetical protein